MEAVSIYCDNFRGFTDTVVTFADVTFLVGENSTGKTSLLSLFGLLHNQDFWNYGNFNADPNSFGAYSDISVHSNRRIVIGCTRTSHRRPRNESSQVYLLAEFENIDNVPTLAAFRYLSAYDSLYITVSDGLLSYHVTLSNSEAPREVPLEFGAWVRDFVVPKDLVKMPNTLAAPGQGPFFWSQLVQGHILEKQKPNDIRYFFRWHEWLYGMVEIVWIAPIRAKPKRTYDTYTSRRSPEGDHIPYVINEISIADGKSQMRERIRKYGTLSGLFGSVRTKRFGRGKTAPFEIIVRLGNHSHKISNVGYGISQVLPVLFETVMGSRSSCFLIQQPEVHLHPKAQAALGELFQALAAEDEKRFIIETHSDFLVDRFRLVARNKPEMHCNAQVMFFQHVPQGNRVCSLPIDSEGRYPVDQPVEFREFFVREQLNLLDL